MSHLLVDALLRIGGVGDMSLPKSAGSFVRVALGLVLVALSLPVTLCGQIALYFATRRAFPGLKNTAFKIVAVRAELSRMGLRADPLSEALLRSLPWASPLVCRAAFGYLQLISAFGIRWHKYPLAGADLHNVPWRDVVALRTQLIDATLRESDATQLVILGAGFDTRALLPLSSMARRFEVDFPPTQAAKRAAVAAAGIDQDGAVTFVAVDFNKDSWLDKLVEAGFDPKQKAVFVWEGVTYYLTPEAVSSTVRLIAQCCSGTTVVLDYFTQELVRAELFPFISRALRAAGEPLLFGLGEAADDDAQRAWTEEHGLELKKHLPGGSKGARWGGVLSATVA
ncbi:hypothetical protein KFE25_013303 [Diacronema lutheri]|uniref:S-adenosyl-L-methionine-dependent methyltransferase n=2 Tax=Diacronema lutheri TaxID=2081491 RepID=A0A8J5XZ78_DIALT|nr:hypothetical protein KFE25_013303 [Diacronema lutheri]